MSADTQDSCVGAGEAVVGRYILPTTHYLVVEDVPNSDDLEITIECSGENGTCWAEEQCDDHRIVRRVRDAEEGMVHGVWHRKTYVGWMVETQTCSLDGRFRDCWDESALDLAHTFGPGRYQVDFDWDDEYTIVLRLVPEESGGESDGG